MQQKKTQGRTRTLRRSTRPLVLVMRSKGKQTVFELAELESGKQALPVLLMAQVVAAAEK